MIAINGVNYYIDVDVLDEELNGDDSLSAGHTSDKKTTTFYDYSNGKKPLTKTVEENEIYKPREVDGLKYELYLNMVRTIMEVQVENEDPGMPFNFDNAPVNFTIAFNTLKYKKILKEI